MAQEAVLKIKEAEDQGKEIIRKAGDEARQLAQSYAANSAEQCGAILVKAKNTRTEIIDKASQKAGAQCEELLKQGESEKQSILNPSAEKLDKAIKFITERIVSV